MAKVNQEFQSAPPGRRVVVAMMIAFAAMVAGAAVSIGVTLRAASRHSAATGRNVVFLAPLAGLLVIVPVFFIQRSRTAKFRIDENVLVVGRKRFPLEGLSGISRDPDILRWAFRIRGNGGLGAIRGRYWSRRVGKFEAFMTDTENAVVLRWPDQTVAVSPADPEFFIHCARSASGLK